MSHYILVIEDNGADVYLIQRALEEASVENPVEVLSDGEKGLVWAQTCVNGVDKPGLIILDLNLPRSDGHAVLNATRANQWLASTPVAVLTTSHAPRDQALVSRYPGARFLVKPVELDEFLQIGRVLRQMLLGESMTTEVTA